LGEKQYTQYIFLHNSFLTREKLQYSVSEKIYKRLKEKETTMLEAIENEKLEAVTTTQEELDLIFQDLKLSTIKQK